MLTNIQSGPLLWGNDLKYEASRRADTQIQFGNFRLMSAAEEGLTKVQTLLSP